MRNSGLVLTLMYVALALQFVPVLAASEDVRRPGHKASPAKWGAIPSIDTTGGIKDFKAIKAFSVPPHWEGGSGHRISHDAYEYRWNREGEKYVELKVRVVTRSLSDGVRQKFKAILATKPHRLTGVETKSVEAALSPADDPQGFRAQSGAPELEIDTAETKDIDGVRVLCFVSGLNGFRGTPQEVVLIPQDETLTTFQEVLYAAGSKEEFKTFRKEAQGALSSLRLQPVR